MKNSNIQWIGEIPDDWEVIAIRYLLENHISGAWGDEPKDDSDNRICMRIADFDFPKMKFKENCEYTIRHYSKAEIANKTLQYGDLLIEKSGGGEKTPVGRTVVYRLNNNALFANFMDCIRIKKSIFNFEYAKYVFYALYSIGVTNLYYNQTIGIQNLLVQKYFREVKFPLPPLATQTSIATYLDAKCSEIDGLIADINKQIETLKKLKVSLVFSAVKGAFLNKKLVATKSEYWKNIPFDWQLKDIKYVFEIIKRIAGKEGYDVLAVTQKGLKIKDVTKNGGQQLAENYSNYQFVYPSDYVMNHMDLLTGWVDCSQFFGVTSPDYRVFRLMDKENNDLRYYKYVMQTCYSNKIFFSLGQGVSNLGRWRLQTDAFKNFQVPIPTHRDQIKIADYLDNQLDKIDNTIDDKQNQISTLEAYKKSLIYEYVTGKNVPPVIDN